MGIHHFCLGKHTLSTRKILKSRIDQNQVIVGRDGDPTLADTVDLRATDGVSITKTLAMEWSTQEPAGSTRYPSREVPPLVP